MTISSETRKTELFVGNGVTVAFPFVFKVFAENDVIVVRSVADTGVETVLDLTTDYTVALNGEQDSNPGGVVTLLVAPTAAQRLIIASDLEFLQPVDLKNQGAYYPKVLSDALDRVTILTQQLAEVVGRTMRGPISDAGATTLPPRATRKGKVLAFDEVTGDPLEGPANDDLALIVANMDDINTVASIPWQLFGVVIATDIDITFTGGAAGTYSATFVQPTLTVTNGVPFPNTDKVWTSSFSISGGSATTVSVGNLQSMSGGFTTYPSTTTSITFPDLVYSSSMTFGTAALTTVDCPVLRTAGTITLSGAALTSAAFPALVSGSVVASGASLTAVSFPAFTTGTVTLSGSALATASFPVWASGASVTVSSSSLTTASFPALATLSSGVTLSGSALTTVSVPALTSISNGLIVSGSSLTNPAFPVLSTVGSRVVLSGAALTTPSFPALTSINGLVGNFYGDLTLSGASLTSPSFPVLTSLVGASGIGSTLTLSGAALANPSFPALTSVSGGIVRTAGALSTLSFPVLTTVGATSQGGITLTGSGLSSVSFPALHTVYGGISCLATGAITTLAFPALTSITVPGGDTWMEVSTPSITTLDLPVLTHLYGAPIGFFYLAGSGITTISFPSLVSVETGLLFDPCSLTSITLPTTLNSVGGDVGVAPGVFLTQASVDNILVRLAALDGTSGTTTYDNKTVTLAYDCAAPSATGLAAKATLQARGNTVYTN